MLFTCFALMKRPDKWLPDPCGWRRTLQVILYLQPMYNEILAHLPYKSSFRFVDEIVSIDENNVTGNYTLRKDAFFYEDHFPGNPVTPGVIVTEIMAQIGLVVLGIYLLLKPDQKTVPGKHE